MRLQTDLSPDSIEHYSKTVSSVATYLTIDKSELNELWASLQLLKDDPLLNGDKELKQLYSDVKESAFSTSQSITPIPCSKIDEIQRRCVLLRLRISLTCLGAFKGVLNASEKLLPDGTSELEAQLETPRLNAPIFVQGDIIISRIDHSVIILIPELLTPHEHEAALHGLQAIYELTSDSGERNWIIDCSAVSTLSWSILGSLLSYRNFCQERGGDMFICWLKPEAIPKTSEQKLIDVFRLNLIGGHYFSAS